MAIAKRGTVQVGAPSSAGFTSNCDQTTKPVSGDLILQFIEIGNATGNPATINSVPSGFSLITSLTSNICVDQYLYAKVSAGSEPASYTWGMTGSDSIAWAVITLSGAETTSILADAQYVYSSTVGQSSLSSASTTADLNNSWLLQWASCNDWFNTWGVPTGMTDQGGNINGFLTAQASRLASLAVNAGATGTKSWGISDTNAVNKQIMAVIVRPPIVPLTDSLTVQAIATGAVNLSLGSNTATAKAVATDAMSLSLGAATVNAKATATGTLSLSVALTGSAIAQASATDSLLLSLGSVTATAQATATDAASLSLGSVTTNAKAVATAGLLADLAAGGTGQGVAASAPTIGLNGAASGQVTNAAAPSLDLGTVSATAQAAATGVLSIAGVVTLSGNVTGQGSDSASLSLGLTGAASTNGVATGAVSLDLGSVASAAKGAAVAGLTADLAAGGSGSGVADSAPTLLLAGQVGGQAGTGGTLSVAGGTIVLVGSATGQGSATASLTIVSPPTPPTKKTVGVGGKYYTDDEDELLYTPPQRKSRLVMAFQTLFGRKAQPAPTFTPTHVTELAPAVAEFVDSIEATFSDDDEEEMAAMIALMVL